MSWIWKRKSVAQQSHKQKKREHVKQVAYEIYQNWLLLERKGDDKSDWETVDKIVRRACRTTLFTINHPLIKVEKYLIEPFSNHLKQSGVLCITPQWTHRHAKVTCTRPLSCSAPAT